MANEARDKAWEQYRTRISPYDGWDTILFENGRERGFAEGYDAHESAIRTAAEAVFKQFEALQACHAKMTKPTGVSNQTAHACPLCDELNTLHAELAALKVALATGKEQTK